MSEAAYIGDFRLLDERCVCGGRMAQDLLSGGWRRFCLLEGTMIHHEATRPSPSEETK